MNAYIRENPYVRESKETYYRQSILPVYGTPVMLSCSPIKHTEKFSVLKKGFEEDAAQVAKVFCKPYEYLGFAEIRNHTLCAIKWNKQNKYNKQDIGPGMVALFAAIFQKDFTPKLKMDPDDSDSIFESCDYKGERYPEHIKKEICFANGRNFIEPNKDMVFDMENPDKQSREDLLTLLKYCKEGMENGFPVNDAGREYYNPLDYSVQLNNIYKIFISDPEMYEMGLELRDPSLLTYKISQKIIKEVAETSKKTKSNEVTESSNKMNSYTYPYIRLSSKTFFFQFVFDAYDNAVMLSYSPIKHAEFSAIKKNFEIDAAQVPKFFEDRPYEYLGFTEIHNHTLLPIKCNNQNIDPGMVALFAAIFKKNSYSPELKMADDSKPIFESYDDPYGLYPKHIKKAINFINDISFMEPNKDTVYIMENPDKESGEDLLAFLKYCKDGIENDFPFNDNGEKYYNPLPFSQELSKVYKWFISYFKRDPEMFEEGEMGLVGDSSLLTYKVSQKEIKEAVETLKKTKRTNEEEETENAEISKKMKMTVNETK